MANEIITRSNILDQLEKVEVLNCEQVEIVRMTNNAAGLLSSVPMICRVERCPYANGCELCAQNIVVFGERCPIELDLVRNMFISYCRQLMINPDVDKVEAGLVKDLCAVEIQALRANKLMSFGDFLVEVVDAIDPVTGDVHYKSDLHVAVAWSERLLNQKIRILDSLVATPMARLKYRGDTGVQGLQEKMAELKRKMEDLMPKTGGQREVFEIATYVEEDE